MIYEETPATGFQLNNKESSLTTADNPVATPHEEVGVWPESKSLFLQAKKERAKKAMLKMKLKILTNYYADFF